MNPMVTMIIPVYNAQDSIRRCIESVLNQGYMDFELLLIDDGSTDASGEICEEYQKKDSRVQAVLSLIHIYNISKNTPISQLIQTRLPISIRIGGCAVLIGAALGLILGVIAAIKHDTVWDSLAKMCISDRKK